MHDKYDVDRYRCQMVSKYDIFVDEDSDHIVRFIGYKNAITDLSDLEASIILLAKSLL